MSDDSRSSFPAEETDQRKSKKKAYVSPILTAYGNIRSLTTGGSGTKQEGKKMTSKKRFP